MKVHRTIRYRLHPRTQGKARKLERQAHACRETWNYFVDYLRGTYAARLSCNPYFMSKRNNQAQPGTAIIFTGWRKHHAWLGECSAHITRYVLKDLETCYKKFYKGVGGLPKFHGRYTHEASFPLPTGTFKLTGEWLHIQKIGQVKLVGNNPYPGARPVSGQVKQEAGDWYAFITYEVEQNAALVPHEIREVGIDRNCGQAATTERAIYRAPVNERLEARKRRYQRIMSRQDAGSRKEQRPPSNRYLRAKQLHQRTARAIVQERTNWIHQLTRQLANKFDVAYMEALNIKGMTASAKGTIEEPGKQVKQKSALNKAILSTGWYQFEQCLGYKTSVVKVPAPYTSQRCAKCGHTEKENRRTQSEFECRVCGHRENADINAAFNILASGNGAAGRGGGDVGRPVKRQTDRKAGGIAPVNFPI